MENIEIASNDVTLVGSTSGLNHNFLLLHAGGETRQVWRPIQTRLARAGLGSVAFDQRGHGESTGSRREDIQCFADDVRQMLTLSDKAQILVGASLGGLAAIMALACHETRSKVCGLVLVDVVPAPDPQRVRNFLSSTVPHLAETFLVDDILDKGDLLSNAASQIKIPVLLVRAGQFGPMSDEEVGCLRELCPQLKVEHVDSASHLIARDAPIRLADILLRFEQSETIRQQAKLN